MSLPRIRYGDIEAELGTDDTVLTVLVREGVEVPNACRAGHCHACLVRGDDPPPAAQRGLKPTLVQQGYFLACQARPERDLCVHAQEAVRTVRTKVTELQRLGDDILRLRLRPDAPIEYTPGQFIQVIHPTGVARSYSLASLPAEGALELHVRRVEGGLVSTWMHDVVEVEQPIEVRGPFGACYYVEDDLDQPLLLSGAGTGLAPLWGIVRDALEHGHRGPMHLIQGALDSSRLYLVDELRRLADAVPQLTVHLCALRGEREGVRLDPLDALTVEVGGALESPRAFLCGAPDLVRRLQRGLFLAGVSSKDILSDPFMPAET